MTDASTDPTTGLGPTVRQRSVRGGLWLALRDSIGTVIRLGGVLALTSLLGPAGFGVYAGAVAVIAFLAVPTQLSIEIYLAKREGELSRPILGTAYTCLTVTSLTVALLGVGVVLLADQVGLPLPDPAVLLLLLASLPLNVLWAPAQAQLERAFAYRQLGVIELIGDVVLIGTSVTLVLAGAGPAGAAGGYLAWQLWLLVASHVLARTWPVWALDRTELRAMLAFGVVMTSGLVLDKAKTLVNPLLVGALLGPVAVGLVALALRVVETLSIVFRATLRLSYVTLATSRDDVPRLRQALDEGGALVVAGMALPLALVCLVSPVGFPLLFGQEWRESADVLAILSLSAVASAFFILPASLLVVQGAQHIVTLAAGLRLVILLPAALWLVPALGTLGYPVAELVSSVGSLVLLVGIRRRLGAPRLGAMATWALALSPPMLTPLVPDLVRPTLWLPLLVLLAVPRSRRALLSTPRMLLQVLRPRG